MDKRIEKFVKQCEIRFKFSDNLEKKINKKLKKENIEYSSVKVNNKKLLKEILQYMLDTPRFQKILKYIDFADITLENINCTSKDFRNTNLDIDPQIISNKTLYGANLENKDMSNKDYTNSCITGANLKNTNSIIDLSKLKGTIEGTDLTNCICIASREELSKVIIDNNTKIDKAVFLDKDSYNKSKDTYQIILPLYAKCLMNQSKNKNRNNIKTIRKKDKAIVEYEECSKFCNELEKEINEKLKNGNLEYSSIKVNNKKLLKKTLQYMLETPRLIKILKYIDFTGITAAGNNCASKCFKDTNLDVNPQTVLNKTLYGANLENKDMSDKDYSNSCITEANLKNTNSIIDLSKLKGTIEGTDLTNCICIASREELKKVIVDSSTKIDKAVFLDKDTHNKYNDSYQVIATPYAKKLIKERENETKSNKKRS